MSEHDRAGPSKSQYRFKHLACNICRQRKLKCNGDRPTCRTCEKTGKDCEWEDTVRKTGPRRGYVRSLESRLAEVEALLEQSAARDRSVSQPILDEQYQDPDQVLGESLWNSYPLDLDYDTGLKGSTGSTEPRSASSYQDTHPSVDINTASWELCAVGLQEPLPSQQAIDELHQIFFDKIYPGIPIIHRGRYLAAMSLPATSRLRPPVCLSYAIWCLAATVSESYSAVTEHFYHRSRKYMEVDELSGRGQGVVTLAHAQTMACLATFEVRVLHFPRAVLSTSRAARLCHMMNLHRLDGTGLDVKEMIASAMSWLELEERRRVFWTMFVMDRYQSVASGWPSIIDERDITTNLPASEEDFAAGQATRFSSSLQDAMTSKGINNLSLFAATALIAAVFGRTLTHVQQKDLYDGNEADSDKAFWNRHRFLDGVLLHTLQYLPPDLQIQSSLLIPRAVMLHINIQASTICLHQASIFKANRFPETFHGLADSKMRCLKAAETLMAILRVADTAAIAKVGPWLPFCLFLAARVFIREVSDSDASHGAQHKDSLKVLMGMIQSMKARNPYTAALLLQLEREMALPGRANPMGHVVVSVDEVTEMLENDKMAQAFTMNPT